MSLIILVLYVYICVPFPGPPGLQHVFSFLSGIPWQSIELSIICLIASHKSPSIQNEGKAKSKWRQTQGKAKQNEGKTKAKRRQAEGKSKGFLALFWGSHDFSCFRFGMLVDFLGFSVFQFEFLWCCLGILLDPLMISWGSFRVPLELSMTFLEALLRPSLSNGAL